MADISTQSQVQSLLQTNEALWGQHLALRWPKNVRVQTGQPLII